MKIRFTETFKKGYSALPKEIKTKAEKQLRFLSSNPKHPSLKIHRIEGTQDFWEFYVDRSYRGVFTREGEFIVLRYIGPHDIIEKAK